ncbi:MAG: outer membrane protein assembly factor BamD [Gammaproteobacteria bacterium]
MKYILAVTLIVANLFVIGCSSLQEKDDSELNAEELFQKGKAALEIGDYQAAISHFESIGVRFPFGTYAQQAQLEMAYAYYKYDERETAISTTERFIKTYPQHEHIDYAYYLRGLASFNPEKDNLDRIADLDPSLRAPRSARNAFQYFSELLDRFPQSQYADDAAQRMVHIRDHLARYELHVANYYMKRGAYLAAANRAKYVLEKYARTTSVPHALAMMVKAYRALELNDLADDALSVLVINYPKYAKSSAIKALFYKTAN